MSADDADSAARNAAARRTRVICGHKATTFDGAPLTCYKPFGHAGLHEEVHRLRDGYTMRTNWRDDGKAPWAP